MMSQISSDAIQKLEDTLRKDPTSQAFVTLVEAYRTQGRFSDAEKVATRGLKIHPRLTSGWVALGKTLKDQKKTEEALRAFDQAIQNSPENLLALQLAGECALELKIPKDALKYFKRLLFFNPNAEKAKRIISKLESLTADEYGEEIFEMTKLSDLKTTSMTAPTKPQGATSTDHIEPTSQSEFSVKSLSIPRHKESSTLMRFLSLVDAFIVRNDIERAVQLIQESESEFGNHPEIEQRKKLLQRRLSAQMGLEVEEPAPLAPLSSREEQVRVKKVALLQAALRRIEGLAPALR